MSETTPPTELMHVGMFIVKAEGNHTLHIVSSDPDASFQVVHPFRVRRLGKRRLYADFRGSDKSQVSEGLRDLSLDMNETDTYWEAVKRLLNHIAERYTAFRPLLHEMRKPIDSSHLVASLLNGYRHHFRDRAMT